MMHGKPNFPPCWAPRNHCATIRHYTRWYELGGSSPLGFTAFALCVTKVSCFSFYLFLIDVIRPKVAQLLGMASLGVIV